MRTVAELELLVEDDDDCLTRRWIDAHRLRHGQSAPTGVLVEQRGDEVSRRGVGLVQQRCDGNDLVVRCTCSGVRNRLGV